MEPVCHENTRSNGVPFQNACLIYEAYLACVQILFRIVIWWKPYWWIVWLAALLCIHGKHSRRVGTITQMLRNLSKYLCYLTEHGKSCHQSSILSVNFWVIPTSPRKDVLTLILSKKRIEIWQRWKSPSGQQITTVKPNVAWGRWYPSMGHERPVV